MVKIDFKKELKTLYSAPPKPVIVDVPEMRFLMIDGAGHPGTSKEYMDAIMTLIPIAYTIKTLVKKQGTEYGVLPLEALWWAEDMEHFAENKDAWQWTSMIMQPPVVTDEVFGEAMEQLRNKKDLPSIDKVRFEAFGEGRSAQVMYVGLYAEEGPAIEKLHAFIAEQGLELAGKHHEIYLSDPWKAAPEKMKTIIRQPVK